MSEKSGLTPVVVVGVDNSPNSMEALRWAASYVDKVGGELHVVSAYESALGLGFQYAPVNEDKSEHDARVVLEHTLHKVLGEAADRVVREVTKGDATNVLVEASRGADLLVVGDRGHGGFAGLLLGSVSEHCVRQAHCSVLVVRTTA